MHSNRQLEPSLPLNFCYRMFRHSALAPNFSFNPLFGKADMGFPWVWQSDSSFRGLPSRPRRRNLKMWSHAIEFAVSCTVAKYIFYCCRRKGAGGIVQQYLWCSWSFYSSNVRVYQLLSFYSSKKYTWLQYKKWQIQVPGTAFSNFSDEVGMEGHGNCCRFATLTGVHQGAHICLAKWWIKGKVRS